MEIPNGYAQANYLFEGDALPTGAEMTLAWDVGGFSGSVQDCADALVVAWNQTAIDDMYSLQVALVGILVKFGPTATGPSALGVTSTPGSASAAAVPPNTAALVHKQTNFGGRAGRGRMYFPGMPEGSVTSAGVLDENWRAALETELNDMVAAAILADLTPVLLHGADSPITVPTPVTGLAVSGTVATQRRRLRR